MKPDLTHWHQDIATNQEEEYRSFLRALRRSQGFGLLFVRCSPAKGGRLIERVRGDLPQKSIEVLTLEEPVEKFYQRVETLPNREQIDILFVEGLELSFYEYEERKRQEGWDSKDIYSYSWKGVPPVLVNLNQQRERFRDNFRFVLVFLLPTFGIDYFIQRAPDFFDWRSGLFEFYDISKVFYRSEEDLKVTLLEIEALLKYNCHSSEDKANLLFQQGLLLLKAKRYNEALSTFDKAVAVEPYEYKALYFRGHLLKIFGRHLEYVANYEKAAKLEHIRQQNKDMQQVEVAPKFRLSIETDLYPDKIDYILEYVGNYTKAEKLEPLNIRLYIETNLYSGEIADIIEQEGQVARKMLLYIKTDPQGRLRNCHPHKYPQFNCHELAKRRLLKNPPDGWKDITEELQVPYSTGVSHWLRKCLPLLQKIAQELGYQPE
ncbi:MAG: hypothetical protein Fur0025_23780 [Oscillatoriaceae cyanobacterium]